MMMEKVKMQSMDITADNIEKIGALFPEAVTEVKKDGKVTKAIDFDVLKNLLIAGNTEIAEGRKERYEFNWPEKKKHARLANQPTTSTLRPVREDSVDFDTTENLYIEGDNLEVLKLLQNGYAGRIKMIYIDPPYNTGNDFVYNDDFKASEQDFKTANSYYDEDGNVIADANTTSNGRFHTDWLNMMYPRLKLAKNLLSDDGVIFISIDDGESSNLRQLCNDIFCESNFIADLAVVNNLKGRNDKKYIARANDRLLMYVKSDNFSEHGLSLDDKVLKEYSLEDQKGKYRLLELRKRGGADTRIERPNMYYPFYVNDITGQVSLIKNKEYFIEALPIKSNGDDGRWRWGKDTAEKNINYLYGKKVGNKYNIYEKDYLENEDGARRVRPKSVLSGASYSTDVATKEYRTIMGKIDFSNPKPVSFIKDLIIYATHPDNENIILDFFSGSSTLAHAVFESNVEENTNRKFILVQLPEKTDEKSEAYKAGYKNICEIGKERIRRAGKKIKEENPLTTTDLDTGFRVLRLDSSNMKDVFYKPEEYDQSNLFALADNVKKDRSDEDLLFQTMLSHKIELSVKIEELILAGKKAFSVDDGYLIACFDKEITIATIEEIAKRKPVYAVVRDAGFATDSDAENFEQIFRQFSPETVRKVI